MKAIVKRYKGIEGVNLEDVHEVEADKNSVKIKVGIVGICGTDLHIMMDKYPHSRPVILGHEFSGVIEEIGGEVTRFKNGDRVVAITASHTCGLCSYCRRGLIMLCSERKSIGSGMDGAMGEYIVVPEKNVLLIPENVSIEAAALTEPLACVIRGLMERASIKAGDRVLVSGCGTIGLLALQVARISGATVVVTGTSNDENKFELARKLGAEAIINIDVSNEEELLRNEFDVVIECAGAPASLTTCIASVKKGGLLIQLGLFGKKVTADFDLMLTKEVDYRNAFATTPTSWEIALKLLEQDKIDLKSLITHRFPITQWREAIETTLKKEGIKTIIHPNPE